MLYIQKKKRKLLLALGFIGMALFASGSVTGMLQTIRRQQSTGHTLNFSRTQDILYLHLLPGQR